MFDPHCQFPATGMLTHMLVFAGVEGIFRVSASLCAFHEPGDEILPNRRLLDSLIPMKPVGRRQQTHRSSTAGTRHEDVRHLHHRHDQYRSRMVKMVTGRSAAL